MSFHGYRKRLLFSAALIATLFGALVPGVAAEDDAGKYLLICAGDQARTAPDFLAVINFDQGSRDYGKVVATAPFAAPEATGNEPHHIGLSSDGKVVACGGLLSVLKGQKEIFFFDVSNPKAPKFISAADPPLSAITDEFHALPDGGYLVTMMGGAQGHAPGRVVAFDKDLQLLKEYPDQPPAEGFNPHGISVRPELNLMVTSDFVCLSTTLDAVHGDIDFRGSVRHFRSRSAKAAEGTRSRPGLRPALHRTRRRREAIGNQRLLPERRQFWQGPRRRRPQDPCRQSHEGRSGP
jgi:hypothetical protein